MEKKVCKLMKDSLLHRYNTFQQLRNLGYLDYSILFSCYEYCLIMSNLETGINYDTKILDNYYRVFEKFLTFNIIKRSNPETVDKSKYALDSFISRQISMLSKIESVIMNYLKSDYNISEEEMIKEMRIDIEYDKGVFGIDSDYYESMVK